MKVSVKRRLELDSLILDFRDLFGFFWIFFGFFLDFSGFFGFSLTFSGLFLIFLNFYLDFSLKYSGFFISIFLQLQEMYFSWSINLFFW